MYSREYDEMLAHFEQCFATHVRPDSNMEAEMEIPETEMHSGNRNSS